MLQEPNPLPELVFRTDVKKARRTFRHGGLSSQSLSSFDDLDDLTRARVNDNGSVVDDNGAVFGVGDFVELDRLGQG